MTLNPKMLAKLQRLTPPLNPTTDADVAEGGSRWDLPIEFSAVARMLSEAATNMAEMAKGYETFWDGGDDEDYCNAVAESVQLFAACISTDAWQDSSPCTELLNAIQVMSELEHDAACDLLNAVDQGGSEGADACAKLGFTDAKGWAMLSPSCLMGAGGVQVSATLDELLTK